MRSRKMWVRASAALIALGLVAAACGDDGDSGSPSQPGPTSPGGTGSNGGAPTTTASGAEPQSGGSITIAMFSETRGLDPAASSGSGTAGGTELFALYDSVVRWNAETREYELRTAESLEPNADFSEWTLKLRPGITFPDGAAYDAQAVKINWDRYLSPANISTSRSWLLYVIGAGNEDNVEVIDDLTVKFTLQVPYSGFPALLSHTPGMIVSPTALAALGPADDPGYRDKADAFNIRPEGAGIGPFDFVSWTRQESIVMRKKANYWDGEVYLDQITFINLNSSDRTYDGLTTGSVNVGFLRSPQAIDNARKDDRLGGIDSFIQAGGMLLMNRGVSLNCTDGQPEPLCVGQPNGPMATQPNTADANVRRAAALAIDPQIINDRVADGLGIASNALFDENFADYDGVEGLEIDLDEARAALQAAKDAGHPGRIRLACTNQPERQALATAVDTMLKNVGFETDIRADIDTATQIGEITTRKDFDLGCWGLSMPNDDTAILALVQNFWSRSATNRVGYANDEWDATLNEAMGATSDSARKAAYRKLAEIWNEDPPSIVFETVVERVAWQNNIHGVIVSNNTMFYLDKAWVES